MNVKPSPCQLASTKTSIEDAIQTIEQTHSSYLLLIDEKEELSGILTKTDICNAIKFLKSDKSYFSRPAAMIMKKPVKSLPLELMHNAPEFMLQNDIEHVPITEYSKSTDSQNVIGVITSDSVFEFMVKLRGIPPIFGGETQATRRHTLGVLSGDGATFRLLHSVFKNSKYINVERLHFSGFDMAKDAGELDALILDIDEVQDRTWLPIIKSAVTQEKPENVFVVYTPEQHANAQNALKQLEIKGVLEIYTKPLDLTQLTVDLEKAWART